MADERTQLNALMDRASSGDDDAFGALAVAVQDELFRTALALGLNREEAAEATQEVLLRAYSARRTWKPGADVLAWLCGIAVNVRREWQRRQKRIAAVPLSGSETGDAAQAAATGGQDAWDADELSALLAALDQLPPRQREAVACRYLRRMSIHDTAQAMGCAEGTVKSAVAAALDRLRNCLQKHHAPF